MSDMIPYTPDNWVVLFFNTETPHYRVLVGWSGGYTTGDSWRMNSGITRVSSGEQHYNFYGASGSSYACHKETYRLRKNNAYVWAALQEKYGDKVTMMPENTDWLNVDWLIK
jgi:hypothetical protein